jgi:hypothetical protein
MDRRGGVKDHFNVFDLLDHDRRKTECVHGARVIEGVWFLATFCQVKVWLAIKVWQPQKVWLKNWKPNFGKN